MFCRLLDDVEYVREEGAYIHQVGGFNYQDISRTGRY